VQDQQQAHAGPVVVPQASEELAQFFAGTEPLSSPFLCASRLSPGPLHDTGTQSARVGPSCALKSLKYPPDSDAMGTTKRITT